MPFVLINDIDLFYQVHGRGIPIVFISGFSTHHLAWTAFIEPLQENFQLILLDNRGAGQSSAPLAPYTIEQFASDTVALMDHLNIDKAHMVGSSMGTAIIQTIAHHYPERIDKAVLIAPFAKLPAASVFKSEVTAKLLKAEVPVELIIETVIPWLFSCDFINDSDKVAAKIQEMRANPYPQSIEGFMGQLAALKNFDSTDFAASLQAECLLLAGEEDLSTPLHCAEFLYSQLPRATLHAFPCVGHMVRAERTQEVLKLVKDFFKR